MSKYSISFDKNLKKAIKKSVKKLSKAVKSTLGPSGTNVLVLSEIQLPIITNDGVTVVKSFVNSLRENNPNALETKIAQILNTISKNTESIAGDGPQPLYSKILTPNGFTTMGEIKKGDIICGTNNTFQKVLDIFPKGKKQIYEVVFSDKRKVQCCEDHLWNITTHFGKNKTLPLKKLYKDYKKRNNLGHFTYKYYTPNTSVEYDEKNLLLDPYTLGVLLGDGSLSSLSPKQGDIEISLGKNKEHIIKKLLLPDGYFLKTTWVESKNYFRIKIKNDKNVDSFHSIIRNLNLSGIKSDSKFIPEVYLYNSKENRASLLQGLLDTDGYKNKRGLYEFSTISEILAKNIVELFRGLGKSVNCRLHTREKDKNSYSNTPIYRINEHKGYKYGHKIVEINLKEEYVEMQCIKVSNKDSLYITDDFVVTHNTTTSITLAEAIILEGIKYIEAGFSPVNISKGIHLATKKIISELDKKSTPIIDKEDLLLQVSSISANNDDELGKIISEAFLKVGVDGQIEIKNSPTDRTYIDIVNGMKYNSGYESNLFINTSNSSVVLDDCGIFIYEGKLTAIEPIQDIIKNAVNEEKPLLIIADDYGPNVVDTLSNIKIQHKVNLCAVKSPSYGIQKEQDLEDIAFITSTKIVSNRLGIDISETTTDLLGNANVKVDNESFTIISNNVSKEEVLKKVKQLKEKVKVANNTEKSELLDRIAKLTNGVAVMYVGGSSPVEISEKMYRAEDAIQSTRASLEEGIVPGGGITLLKLGKALKTPKMENESQVIGFNILKKALEAPITTIAENCDENGQVVINEVLKGDFTFGYDAKLKEYKDLLAAGIIDPKKVTKTALMNASSVSQMILTLNAAIY